MPLAGQTFDSTTGNTYDKRKSQNEFDEFVRNEAALERKKLEQSVQPLTVVSTEVSHAMRLHTHEMAFEWSRPLIEIQTILDSKKWTSLYWLLHLREDAEPRIKQSAAEAEQAYREYIANLSSRTGFKLNPDGIERLAKMVVVQLRCGRIEVAQETVDVALDVFLKNHCFHDGEVDYNAEWKTAAPTQQIDNAPTVVDFEALNLTETAAAPTAKAWLDSLAKNFGFVPTKEDLAYSVKWFRENNRSWFDRSSYDAFRLHMIHIGRWSTALLSESDIRARAIERLDTNDRDVRGIVFHGSKEALLDLLQRRGVSLI
jgi:hypothetical protein